MSGPFIIPCPLRELAERRPAGIFLSTSAGELSYAEMEQRVREVRKQIQPTSGWICISEPLSAVESVVQLLAGLRAGIPVAVLNVRHPAQVLDEQQKGLAAAIQSLPEIRQPQEGTWDLRSPATILFTSGSSGRPKALLHSLANHWASANAACAQAPLAPGDRWLCSLPLYHVGGLAILFRCLTSGATVCFPDAGQSLSESIRFFRPTHLSLVPTQLTRWLKDPEFDSSGIKRVLLGGAPLPEGLRRRAEEKGVPLAVSYGMTETASQVAATPPGETARGAGRPLGHAELRISEQGEILLKGPSVAVGILEEKGLVPITDQEGWLHTRDVGRIEEGLLMVEGRMDRQFISGGENIQPEQIERALLDLPEISEAVVVPIEDEEFGCRPFAWVDAELSGAEWERMKVELRKVLPGYMIPVGVSRLPEMGVGLKRRRGEWGGNIGFQPVLP